MLAVKPYKLLRVLKKLGFFVHHQTGSHVVLKHSGDETRRVVLPMHKKELKARTLGSILSQAGINIKEIKRLI